MNSRAHAMVEFALPLPSHTCAQLPENKYHSKAQLGDVHVCQQPIWFGAANEKKYDFESETQIISILSENSSTALTKIVFNPTNAETRAKTQIYFVGQRFSSL